MRTALVPLLLLPLLAVPTASCAHPRPARPAKVVVLDDEHEDPTIVIVRTRPAHHRHCWRHRRHWHCRR